MQITFQLIQIVKDPNDKNCWLAINDYPQLKEQFESFIQDYDFIDFEGKVFYYNELKELPINDVESFLKRYNKSSTLFSNEELEVLLKFLSLETQHILLSHFVEGITIALIKV
jgi:D-alanyl-lipoteichoic acid acyltransferase DltB (MBOAT superfamily)